MPWFTEPPKKALGRPSAIVNLEALSAEQFMDLGRVSAFTLFAFSAATGFACMSMNSIS
jgi:hypothetical protein